MRMRFRVRRFLPQLVFLTTLSIAGAAHADGTPQTLPFTQSWTVTTQITTDDVWTGVPGIVGYNGNGMGTSGTADPQTLLGVGSESQQVKANQTATTLTLGGVAEFDGIPNPVVAVQGSGTAGAPNLVITLNTLTRTNITVAYTLRDLDAVDDAVQRVALQYRVGITGNYTNLPAGYIADATSTGATLTTNVSVVLPAACENQALVEIRIITANATGNDEWVGIDDISVTATPSSCGNNMMDAGEACDTGALNGTTTCGCTTSCTFASPATVCAAAGSAPCDAPDTCSGTGTCAARVKAAGTVCNPSMGMCDPAETCDGAATTCPANVVSPSTTECRAAVGACDVAEHCSGAAATPDCPANAFASSTTACDDTLRCNGADTCNGSGTCMHAGNACTAPDACTTTMCSETGTMCTNTAMPDCCLTSASCDDGNACTTDVCTMAGGVCVTDPIANCCTTNAMCDDSNACTTDTCDTTAHTCMHAASCTDAAVGVDAAIAHDAGTSSDSGASADASRVDAARVTTPRSSGCACVAVGSGSSTVSSILLALAIAWIARRRVSTGVPGKPGRHNCVGSALRTTPVEISSR